MLSFTTFYIKNGQTWPGISRDEPMNGRLQRASKIPTLEGAGIARLTNALPVDQESSLCLSKQKWISKNQTRDNQISERVYMI